MATTANDMAAALAARAAQEAVYVYPEDFPDFWKGFQSNTPIMGDAEKAFVDFLGANMPEPERRFSLGSCARKMQPPERSAPPPLPEGLMEFTNGGLEPKRYKAWHLGIASVESNSPKARVAKACWVAAVQWGFPENAFVIMDEFKDHKGLEESWVQLTKPRLIGKSEPPRSKATLLLAAMGALAAPPVRRESVVQGFLWEKAECLWLATYENHRDVDPFWLCRQAMIVEDMARFDYSRPSPGAWGGPQMGRRRELAGKDGFELGWLLNMSTCMKTPLSQQETAAFLLLKHVGPTRAGKSEVSFDCAEFWLGYKTADDEMEVNDCLRTHAYMILPLLEEEFARTFMVWSQRKPINESTFKLTKELVVEGKHLQASLASAVAWVGGLITAHMEKKNPSLLSKSVLCIITPEALAPGCKTVHESAAKGWHVVRGEWVKKTKP